MKSEHAQQILNLIKVIDADNLTDFVKSVCDTRDLIPDDAIIELAEIAFDCESNIYSSRICEIGTKSCVVEHRKKK